MTTAASRLPAPPAPPDPPDRYDRPAAPLDVAHHLAIALGTAPGDDQAHLDHEAH